MAVTLIGTPRESDRVADLAHRQMGFGLSTTHSFILSVKRPDFNLFRGENLVRQHFNIVTNHSINWCISEGMESAAWLVAEKNWDGFPPGIKTLDNVFREPPTVSSHFKVYQL